MDNRGIIFLIVWWLTNSVNSDSYKTTGGKSAKKGQFPFLVSVQNGNSHICGGSLIASDWVISAAKCFDGIEGFYSIVAGTNKLDSEKSARIPVSYVIIHEDYDPYYLSNNVALLKLSKPVHKSKVIEIVEMEKKYVKEPRNCIAVGWEFSQNPSLTAPNSLFFLNTKSMSMDYCQDKLQQVATLYVSDICTFNGADQGYCQGGLGNPVVVKERGKFKLIALMNWGAPCSKEFPDVSSRISYYFDWIKKIMDSC